MTVLPSNMFNTVVLPAMLWFFDKAKPLTEKKDEVLFVDARKIYTQVDATHRKFTEEQQRCLALITRLYEGDAEIARLEGHLNWLKESFPEGRYRDVTGLCKKATSTIRSSRPARRESTTSSLTGRSAAKRCFTWRRPQRIDHDHRGRRGDPHARHRVVRQRRRRRLLRSAHLPLLRKPFQHLGEVMSFGDAEGPVESRGYEIA